MITMGLAFILITLGRCWVAVVNRPFRDVAPKLKSWEYMLYGLLLIIGCVLIILRLAIWILVNMP
jgi:hypothetical protein